MSGDNVTGPDDAIRRSLGALRPEEFDEHPGHEALEAYVEGRLPAEQAAAIDRLAARSAIVAEDIADLRAVQEAMRVQPVARRNVRWARIAFGAGIAASLIAGIWITSRPAPAPPTPASISRLDPAESARVQNVIARGRIELTPDAIALIQREGTLLGPAPSAAAFGPLSPVGTAIRSTRPVFTWSANGADAYTVAIFDEAFNEVARSPRVTGTSWTPDVGLTRAQRYVWQVTAHRGSDSETEPKPPRPEARFGIVDQATASRYESALIRLHDEPLALGILLTEAGLIADARTELERAALDPRTSEIARRLLSSLDQGTPTTTKPAQ